MYMHRAIFLFFPLAVCLSACSLRVCVPFLFLVGAAEVAADRDVHPDHAVTRNKRKTTKGGVRLTMAFVPGHSVRGALCAADLSRCCAHRFLQRPQRRKAAISRQHCDLDMLFFFFPTSSAPHKGNSPPHCSCTMAIMEYRGSTPCVQKIIDKMTSASHRGPAERRSVAHSPSRRPQTPAHGKVLGPQPGSPYGAHSKA